MHRRKKLIVTATAAALLMAAGSSSAMAVRGNDPDDNGPPGKVTICHATGSETNPYQRINVSENAAEAHDHHQHDEDLFFEDDDNTEPCPTTPPTEPPGGGNGDDDDADCSAESESGDSTQSQSGLVNVGNINLGLNNLLGNAFCQSLNGLAVAVIGDALGGHVGDDDSGDASCLADDVSGDSEQEQEGLINVGNINVGGNNLLGNAFCQSLNGPAVAVIGDAVAGDLFDGDGDEDGDGDCIASSDAGDSEQEQDGGVNVGNINVGGNNLLGNAFCQSLNGLAVSVIGTAVGGGSGLLSSGPLGLLSGVGYLVPSVMADVDVVAGLLLSL
jgi:hypothetical protein